MWQALRSELHPLGVEIVTVGLDSVGADGCRAFIEAAAAEHPSLVDTGHVLSDLFGVVNIPNGVWIDEDGMIVRPIEPAHPRETRPEVRFERDERLSEKSNQAREAAAGIIIDTKYASMLRDWAAKGAESEFVLDPDEVVARSGLRDGSEAQGRAHFALGAALWAAGDSVAAQSHWRKAQRLDPDNVSSKRQAWSLTAPGAEPGSFQRFRQGPVPGNEADWPYDSDWLTDILANGPANYYPPLDT